LIFFDSDSLGKKCYYKLGVSYLALHQHAEAATNFDLAYLNSNDDSLKVECTFLKCLTYMLDKNFEYALLEIFNLPETLSTYNQNKKLFYEASVYLMKDEFNTSDSLYEKLFKQNTSLYESYLLSHKKFKKDNRLKIKTAKTLSYILPGAGQFYARDTKNGLNSLLLTAAVFSVYLVVAKTVSPIEAIVGISPWFQRYYQGGIKHAGIIAAERKEKIKKQYYVQLIDLYRNFNNEKNKN
jgi:hypothetical protein